jgi:predicted DNA-binding transcriptional regulator AlpA
MSNVLTEAVEAEVFLTRREVGRLMRVGPATISRWTQANEFPKPVNVGGSQRWLRSSIVAWIAEQEAAARV